MDYIEDLNQQLGGVNARGEDRETHYLYVMGSARCCLGTAYTFPLKALSSPDPLEFSTWEVFIQLSDSAHA